MTGFLHGPFPTRPVPTPNSATINHQVVLAGGDSSQPSQMLRYGYISCTFQRPGGVLNVTACAWVPQYFPIQGADILSALQLAGAGKSLVGVNFLFGTADTAILFDAGVTPRAWFSRAIYGPYEHDVWKPATSGLPVGDGVDMASAQQYYLGEALAAFAGPATRFAPDGLVYGSAGTPPSAINRVEWEPWQNGVYLAAADGGILKTIDKGAHWGYVRPHATIGTTWPAGAKARRVKILNAPIPAAAIASLMVAGSTLYRLLGADNVWTSIDGAVPTTHATQLKYFGGGVTLHLTADPGSLRYSGDTGATWTTRAVPGTLDAIRGYDRDNQGRIWICGRDGLATGQIYYSDDNGANFTLSTSWAINVDTGQIGVNPANRSMVAATYMAGGSGDIAVRVSQNGGASWTNHTIGGSTFSPGQASGAVRWIGTRLLVFYQITSGTHLRCHVSDDYGATWSNRLDINVGDSSIHLRDVLLATSLGPIFIALDKLGETVTGCIQRSTDHGQTWTALDAPFGSLVSCVGLAYDVITDTLFMIGDNGLIKSVAGATTKAATEWLGSAQAVPSLGASINGSSSQIITVAGN